LEKWAREDEQEAGLPKGSLDNAVGYAKDFWEGNVHGLKGAWVSDPTGKYADEDRGKTYGHIGVLAPEEKERLRRSLMKDTLNAYLQLRGHSDIPILKNPILFGRQEHLAKLKPEDIQTLTIPSAQIPIEALVTTGSDAFLHEVRAYSDVPLWKKLQSVAKKEAAFDESKHPREPGGSSEGGQFAATGRVGSATSDPVLAEQAKTGIIAVEKLLPQAVKTARYDQTPEPKIWDEVDDSTQDAVRSAWEEEQYGNLDVDTRGLEDEVRAEVGRDNQGVLDKAFEDTIATLDHAKPFKDTDSTLPLTLSLHKTLDPDTIDYGAGDHEEAGWYPSGRKNHGGTVELDLDALRFTSGEELTLEQKNIVKEHWDAAYNENYLQAVEKALESESYSERVSQLESEQISAEWNNLLDRDKLSFMIEHKLNVITKPGEPDRWTTGVKEGTHSDANYARTHAIALKLTELRMDELRKERGLLKPLPTEPPTFTVHESRNHTESHPSYVAKNAAGEVVAASNTIAQVTQNAKDWATNQMTLSDDLSSKKIISEVWESWKVKSGEGLGLSLQLAAARELGGHHRMTPGEVEYAELDAKSVGGIETLQAYVRAQWEVTQMVMKKAGEDKIDVYRGLMLPGDVVRTTPREMFTPNAKPVAPPANVKALHRKEPGREKEEYVTFDYMGEHFVVEKEVVMVRPKEDIDPGETDVAEIETTEAAVQRRVAAYHESTQGRALAFIKLPALQLKRAGAQSTTGTADVANDWGGVGDLPPDPVRVVLRIEAPPTSVLSLPVYGENNQSEHESVLLGTRDRWLWDAWRDRAPLFKNITVTTGGQMAQKADTLVIDLQAEDRGKPHWMSSVDWSTVQKFDESQHPRDGKGRFAYHGTSNELAQKILKEGLKPLSEMDRSSPVGKGFASTSEKVALSYAAMASNDSVDTITVIVFKPEASRYFQPANKHAFGPSGSWAQARRTEMSSTETVPPEMIHEVRQYQLADVVAALGPQGGKQYADWESSLEDVDPVKVVKKQEQVIYVAFLTMSEAVLKWDASKHPREPKGGPSGGQFTEGVGQGGEKAPQPHARTGSGRGGTVPAKATTGRPEAVPEVQAVADAYNAKHGLPPVQHDYVTLDEARAGTIADAYDALPLDDSGNPEVREAYKALAQEVRQQFDHIVKSGVTFTPWAKEGQPYQNSAEMVEDIRTNQHMFFYTGGEPNMFMAAHDSETGLTTNDMFRAVHDYFGHAAGGYGFGPRGEENAWRSHSQMLSASARRALTTETRGQNSWVNFGRHNYDAEGNYKKIPPQQRPFATQKTALLPESYAVMKWDESQHPRDDEGQFTRVAMTSQRPVYDPEHKENKVVFQHMGEFKKALSALPGVSRVSVKPGVGGWDGGSESMWQVYYRGNGEARKLVARTAKAFNQDSVLILKKCGGQDCQPAVELSFEGGVDTTTREYIHGILVKNGITGWTWMKRDGKTLLRMVSVPQWGGVAEKHQKDTVTISQKLRSAGLENHRRVHKVRVEVMEREGENSYDRFIG
jgi:hypothetical protein